jgi:L-asparaginase
MNKSHIYIIYTGGTIGMKKTADGYQPVPDFLAEHIHNIPDFYHEEMPYFTIEECDPLIDSSNMQPEHWNTIAQMIEKNYQQYDGFVILHGTDTMAYTAAALSFMMNNLSKPIIITGSQIPVSQLRSDGQQNLLNALYIAANYPINEVSLFFNNQLFRGNRTTKICADSFDAFSSPNHPVLLESGIQIKLRSGQLTPPQHRKVKITLMQAQACAIVTLYPGMSLDLLRHVLSQPIRALILCTYGAGNAPHSPPLIDILKQAQQQNILLINLSQCLQGKVNMDSYATGRTLQKLGMLSGADMTLEAAITKVYYLLSQRLSNADIKKKFCQNLKGELTP